MNSLIGGLFTFSDRLKMDSLNHRLTRNEVINANVANAETPGFRALGYGFEEQLQSLAGDDDDMRMATSSPKHFRSEHVEEDGTIHPDVFIKPTESVGEDGNTVDVDEEMARLAQNEITYQATVELLNRKFGILRYAITSGGKA